MASLPLASHAPISPLSSRGKDRPQIDLDLTSPDPHLIRAVGPELCLRSGFVPVLRIGNSTLVAFDGRLPQSSIAAALPKDLGEPIFCMAAKERIEQAIIAGCGGLLVARAEECVCEHESCRFWYTGLPRKILLAAIGLLVLAAFVATEATLTLAFGWAIFSLICVTIMKLPALWPAAKASAPQQEVIPAQMPRISVMVPLFREEDILPRLIARLSKLDYPKDRLEVCLVTEGDDITTRRMLTQALLPNWMRMVSVPPGNLRTKPRALNFALDMCQGEIIGIWDAEDAPEADQLLKVAQRFAICPTEVACLQGSLDYYNAKQNWITRCFTIEYGGWWRGVLPGIGRMGFVLPLGGTSLFFRRDVLEHLDRWDAHNVTEDADLGIRLARHGYRTEIIPTATHEEATSRVWPWVRQRSRWLKGFMMTWCTHMRFPRLLLRQIGFKKFLGLQVLLLCSLSQILLAPLLWSLWLIPLGLGHPLQAQLSGLVLSVLVWIFLTAEAVTLMVGCIGAVRAKKPWLLPWVPTLHLYFPLATLAAYKAIWELVFDPFYWDKTEHGLSDQTSLA